MHKNPTAFRITLMFYLGILLLPIVFYFSYRSFDALEMTMLAVETQRDLTTNMLGYMQANNITEGKKSIERMETAIDRLRPWIQANKNNPFNVGGNMLPRLDALRACVSNLDPSAARGRGVPLECSKMTGQFGFAMEKMLQLQLEQQRRLLYLSFIGMFGYLIFLTYIVRLFIDRQLRKDAIKDLETMLFNRQFFEWALQGGVSAARRNGVDVSLVCIDVKPLTRKNNEENRQQLQRYIHDIAKIVGESVRESDMVSRYDEDTFMILLNKCDERGGKVYVERLTEELEKNNMMPLRMQVHQIGIKEDPKSAVVNLAGKCRSA